MPAEDAVVIVVDNSAEVVVVATLDVLAVAPTCSPVDAAVTPEDVVVPAPDTVA